ncbi:MAG: prenyltransferase/squalene oxidase repeat-containing protein [Planctomycetaceae bacterium]
MLRAWLICGVLAAGATTAAADEPVTIDNYEAPTANSKDEPLAAEFSLEQAGRFLDSASLEWLSARECFACHTNFAYLTARPLLDATAPAHQTIRAKAEELVEKRWPEKGPRWDTEVVATAWALAFNDAATTNRLHSTTKTALDRMWTVQREDGGFTWIKCGWPPSELDDEYGAVLALIAVGVAPENYRESEAAKTGVKKIQAYLEQTPLPSLHHQAMHVWADSYLPDLLTAEQSAEIVKDLLSKQLPDGGWSAATLGDWKRGDDTEQQTTVSDGYGTGFSLYVLRRAGLSSDDTRIRRGVDWLKSHQRESGRWFARSVFKDSKHYLTHNATAFAVMALRECGEIPQPLAAR